MSDIIETIDAATDGRCACGCGRKLATNGPSAYWATENCQLRWQSRDAVADGTVTHDAAPEMAAHVRAARSTRSRIADDPSAPLFVGGPWHGRRYNTWQDGHYPDMWIVPMPPGPLTISMFEPMTVANLRLDRVAYHLRWCTGRDMRDSAFVQLARYPAYVSDNPGRDGQGHADTHPYDRATADHLLAEIEYQRLPTCVVPECTAKAPMVFIAAEPGRLAGRSWCRGMEIRVCPEHGTDIYRAQGVYGIDELAEWLRADAQLDTLDAFDAAKDLLYGQQISDRRARSLRVQARP